MYSGCGETRSGQAASSREMRLPRGTSPCKRNGEHHGQSVSSTTSSWRRFRQGDSRRKTGHDVGVTGQLRASDCTVGYLKVSEGCAVSETLEHRFDARLAEPEVLDA